MTTYAPQTTNEKAPEWARSKSHLCGAIATLKAQLNAANPNRDRTSDGFIGDSRHLAAGTSSDHNPWVKTALGWAVRAGDFDKDGINPDWFAEQLRLAGSRGDGRLIGGGYVIWNGHITLPDFSGWTPYLGDPHTGHVHVSVNRTPACELTEPWAFLAVATPASQPTDPGPIRPAAAAEPAGWTPQWTGPDARGAGGSFRADVGDNGHRVQFMQNELNRVFPAYSQLTQDGEYGPLTAGVVAEFAHRAGQDPNCLAGDREGLGQSDGQNVGPRVARAFQRYGLNL